MRYESPATIDETVAFLAEDGARLIAGGTDFYPHLKDAEACFPVIDITGVSELRGIKKTADGWRFGAATTWTDIIKTPLPPAFDGLKLAAREVGSIQIQNAGTVAGNLCTASPAADSVPPWLTLGASVELAGTEGSRVLALEDFITGPRQTALQPGEIVTGVHVPEPSEDAVAAFLKLGARKYLVISIAMTSVLLLPDGSGRVADARIAVGSCSPVACRLPALEAALSGVPLETSPLADCVAREHLAPLAPINDIRGTAAYRHDAVVELVRRALAACVDG